MVLRVRVHINHRPVIALVDTGASHSCISEATRQELMAAGEEFHQLSLLEYASVQLKSAGGRRLHVLGSINMPFVTKAKGREPAQGFDDQRFIVVRDLGPAVILGMDFLCASSAIIDLKEDKMLLHPHSQKKKNPLIVPFVHGDGSEPKHFEQSPGLAGTSRGALANILAYECEAREEQRKALLERRRAIHAQIAEFCAQQLGHLDARSRRSMMELLKRNWKAFAVNPDAPACTSELEMRIDTGSAKPISSKTRFMHPSKKAILERQIKIWLEAGKIVPSTSPWNSCPLIVPKPNGGWRVCVDFRRLNSVTVREDWPPSLVPELMQKLSNCDFLSSLDLANAYFQIPLAKSSQEKTAFSAPSGRYQFTAVPFGLRNAPTVFNAFFSRVLSRVRGVPPPNFFDDVAIGTRGSFAQHMRELEEVFRVIIEAGLELKLAKCEFAKDSIKFCGHVVTRQGLQPDIKGAKVQNIIKLAPPSDLSGVRRFLGALNFFREYISRFATKAAPLYSLLTKGNGNRFAWGAEQDVAFRQLKQDLLSSPVLVHVNWDLTQFPFTVTTDASTTGLGACLFQMQADKRLRPVTFLARSLSVEERKYDVMGREALAIHWAVTSLKEYLMGARFFMKTDHAPLKYIADSRTTVDRVNRWFLSLSEYDFEVHYIKGVDNKVADYLSRVYAEGRLEAARDAAVTNGRLLAAMGGGDTFDAVPPQSARTGSGSVNMAHTDTDSDSDGESEEAAEIFAPDSDDDSPALPVPERRMSGRARRAPTDALEDAYARDQVSRGHRRRSRAGAPRERAAAVVENAIGANDDNIEGDLVEDAAAPRGGAAAEYAPARRLAAAAHQAARARPPQAAQAAQGAAPGEEDLSPPVLNAEAAQRQIAALNTPLTTFEELLREQRADTLVRVLREETVDASERVDRVAGPDNEVEHDARRLAQRWATSRKAIFGERADGLLCRVTPRESQIVVPMSLRERLLREYHALPEAGHYAPERTLAALRRYFWWPKMATDVTTFCGACETCAMLGGPDHSNVRVAPWGTIQLATKPRMWWHADFIGPLPRTRGGFCYLLVFVDEYSNWFEVYPTRNNTSREIIDGIRKLSCQWGTPYGLRTDNSSDFRSAATKAYAQSNGIKLAEIPPYSPQSNGKVEVFNRTFKNTLASLLAGCMSRDVEWIDYADQSKYAMNAAVCRGALNKFSAFQLMMGTPANNRVENAVNGAIMEAGEPEEHVIGREINRQGVVNASLAMVQKLRERTARKREKENERIARRFKPYESLAQVWIQRRNEVPGTKRMKSTGNPQRPSQALRTRGEVVEKRGDQVYEVSYWAPSGARRNVLARAEQLRPRVMFRAASNF